MPAPWGPYPPDHDALVAERERRADEGEMPVVPKEECVVAGREAVVECEIVVRMTPATPRVTAAPMTVHRQRASRGGGAQGCECSRRDDELAEHRVPPFWDPSCGSIAVTRRKNARSRL